MLFHELFPNSRMEPELSANMQCSPRSCILSSLHEKAFRYLFRAKKGSLTVECALVLPLFLMAVIVLLTIPDFLSGMLRTELTLTTTAKEMAVYAGTLTDTPYGDHSDWVDLTLPYSKKVPFFSHFPLTVPVRARVRKWTGYDASSFPADTESSRIVYVTEYESVYHTHADCTHLDLTILTSTTEAVGSLRNEYGERYRPCDGFPQGYSGTVYLTPKGDRYYPSTDYGSLTRHVKAVPVSSLDDLPLCERCSHADHAA